MANKYIGHAFFTLKKMAACENFTLLKALQYAFFTRHVCIMHVENEPMLNIGKRALSILSGNNTRSVFFMKSGPSGVRGPSIRQYDGFGDTFDVDSLNTHGDVLEQKERE